MGARFDLSSTNIISYLISRGRSPLPRLTIGRLEDFFRGLTQDRHPNQPALISSDPYWIHALRLHANEAADELRRRKQPWDAVVDPQFSQELLDPFAATFGQYTVYILPVGSWRDSAVLERFADSAARIPGHGILVLIPDMFYPEENIQVLDPEPSTLAAVENRDSWPGAVFMLKDGQSRYFELEEAHARLAELARHSMDPDIDRPAFERLANLVVTSPPREPLPPRRRILHLSDLHFGTERASQTQTQLIAGLAATSRPFDRVVITGDLVDTPGRRPMQQYKNFFHQLQTQHGTRPVVVPGNHDQRLAGNSLFGLGRRPGQLADFEPRLVQPDPESRLVFFCFDSARTGTFAKGQVEEEQLVRMGTSFDAENTQGRLEGYLRVALVHHHPYRYRPDLEPSIDPRTWVDPEDFVAMDGAEKFVTWCAAREIGLILHGHKHIPRLLHECVPTGAGNDIEHWPLTVVGCGSSLGAGGSHLSFNIIEWQPESQSWSVNFQIAKGDGTPFKSASISSFSAAGAKC